MDNLNNYRVHLRENITDRSTIVFDCWAEDKDHAQDQALDMYPESKIVFIAEE